MPKLYVVSKKLNDKQYLIGELSFENNEYVFEYKLGDKLPKWHIVLDDYFPDTNRVYRGVEVRPFIEYIVPAADDEDIEDYLRSAGLTAYNEWELVKHYGKHDPRQNAYVYEKLPQGLVNV
jgi:hypothetical protein